MESIDRGTREIWGAPEPLRVAIAVGGAVSPLWATEDLQTGEPRGPTVDLGRLIAERIGAPLTLVKCASSGEIIETASKGVWDLSFTPIDEERKKSVHFGSSYFHGESTYMVPENSTINSIEDVDREGVRIYGVENTATIRSARRSLKNTTALGVLSLDEILGKFRVGEVDAVALGRESLQSLLPQFPGARVLDGYFHATATALAVPRGRLQALEAFSAILDDLKRDGTVLTILRSHGIGGTFS